MTDTQPHKNLVTPEGTLSFVDQVWEKGELPGDNQGYSCMIMFPKSDKKAVKEVEAAIQSAFLEKFGTDEDEHPVEWESPLKDGDTKAEKLRRQKKQGDQFKDMWYISATAKDRPGRQATAPGVVGPDTRPMTNKADLYSGCVGRLHMNLYGYAYKNTSFGVGAGLLNVMKVADGERIDGRVDGETAFGDYAVESTDSGDEPEFE